MAILELSSRFHLTVGVGLPVALHLRVTLEPSRTITSLELSESSMFGGTGTNRNKKENIMYYDLLLHMCISRKFLMMKFIERISNPFFMGSKDLNMHSLVKPLVFLCKLAVFNKHKTFKM